MLEAWDQEMLAAPIHTYCQLTPAIAILPIAIGTHNTCFWVTAIRIASAIQTFCWELKEVSWSCTKSPMIDSSWCPRTGR